MSSPGVVAVPGAPSAGRPCFLGSYEGSLMHVTAVQLGVSVGR
jgi:hypothetical protein